MASRLRLATSLLVDLVLPVALYCGLRAMDVDEWLALALGEALPIARLGYRLIRQRRLAAFAIGALVVLVGARVLCVAILR